jgi:hypothetical protein
VSFQTYRPALARLRPSTTRRGRLLSCCRSLGIRIRVIAGHLPMAPRPPSPTTRVASPFALRRILGGCDFLRSWPHCKRFCFMASHTTRHEGTTTCPRPKHGRSFAGPFHAIPSPMPRLGFNRSVVVRYRSFLEGLFLSATTINLHLSAIRRLAEGCGERVVEPGAGNWNPTS